jgi:hypothetical protein
MTKTFKIGEYASGGTIKVLIPKTLTTIKIQVLDTNSRAFDRSREEPELISEFIYYSFHRSVIEMDLFRITTSYWAGKITDYIATIMQTDSAPMIGSRCRI